MQQKLMDGEELTHLRVHVLRLGLGRTLLDLKEMTASSGATL